MARRSNSSSNSALGGCYSIIAGIFVLGMCIIEWMQKNPVLTAIIVIGVISLILLIVYLVRQPKQNYSSKQYNVNSLTNILPKNSINKYDNYDNYSETNSVANNKQFNEELQQSNIKEQNLKSEQYIQNAVNFESQKDYINAINEYTKAIALNPENIVELYIFRAECCMQIQQYKNVVEDCTQAIELSTNLNSNAYYTRGLAYQNLNDKPNAINDIQKAISINPDNQTYKNTLNELLQNNNTIIDIESCTQEDIVTLGCFSNAKAERFIQERNNGKMWYDIDSFVQDFELQPHEMVMIQDRIKFPEKPKNKYGRKIDI